jgi:hypothetical protein
MYEFLTGFVAHFAKISKSSGYAMVAIARSRHRREVIDINSRL